jgi:hypothetical protein
MASATSFSQDFRSVVLRGANVASYKFALAKSILTLAESGSTSVSLEDLAVPFSLELCTHIRDVDTQSTSAGSRLLEACRCYNSGTITTELGTPVDPRNMLRTVNSRSRRRRRA